VIDRVIISVTASEKLETAVFAHMDYIKKETLANELTRGSGNEKLNFKIDDYELGLSIKKVG